MTLNAEKGLAHTIESVLEQSVDGLEVIIVDGGSVDGTQQIIARYRDQIARSISERDRGIYDAMNKGVRLATADWVLFLNAGDTFATSESLAKLMSRSDDADVVYGDCLFVREDGSTRYYQAKPAAWLWARMSCPHPSTMVRRLLLLDQPFDLRYRIAADHDFLLACWVAGRRFERVRDLISIFHLDGISTKRRFASIREAWQMSLRRNPRPYTSLFYGARITFSVAMLCYERLVPTAILKWVGRRQSRENTTT